MGARDPRVDAYIAKSADFAKPILSHLRKVVHAGCPEVEETMKWSIPHFMHKGMLAGMASFQRHCTFGFWKGALVDKALGGLGGNGESAMGQFGRITSLSDLPPEKILVGYVRKAVELNDRGVKAPRAPASKGLRRLAVPADFMAALRRNRKALATFEAFPYSKKQDYVEWMTEAKLEATRKRRLATAVEWLAEGKSRNWKYERR